MVNTDRLKYESEYPIDKSIVNRTIQKNNWQVIIDSLKNYFFYLKDKKNKSKWTQIEKTAAASINQKLIYGDKKFGYLAWYKMTKMECKVMKDVVKKYRLDNNKIQYEENSKKIKQLVLDMRCDLIIGTLNHWIKGTGGKTVEAIDRVNKDENGDGEKYYLYYPPSMPSPTQIELQQEAKKILNL